MLNMNRLDIFSELSAADLTRVSGGNAAEEKWQEIRSEAGEHCPKTVATYPNRPEDRAHAQEMGAACIAEMGSIKANMFRGAAKINAGIDLAFPAP